MVTIGVAVAIPEPWGTRLQEYRQGIGDTSAGLIPTHITLVPPLDLDDDLLDGVADHLDSVAAGVGAFDVHLRGTGTFRPVSEVVFVMLAEGISACEVLASRVRSGPLGVDLAYPYHPHVTVGHDLPAGVLDRAFAELADFECRFEVDRFHLYVHDAAAGWEPQRTFALTGAAVTPAPVPGESTAARS